MDSQQEMVLTFGMTAGFAFKELWVGVSVSGQTRVVVKGEICFVLFSPGSWMYEEQKDSKIDTLGQVLFTPILFHF